MIRTTIVIDPQLVRWLQSWGRRHGVKGYRDRITWQALLAEIAGRLAELEDWEQESAQ